MERTFPFLTMDVFTRVRFGGNPLAVVFEAGDLNTAQMMDITREFNLSETVFVLPPDDPAHTARLRIFTPARELPFAGHPTVGAALALHAHPDRVPGAGKGGAAMVLEEGVGPIAVAIRQDNNGHASAGLTLTRPLEPGPSPPPAEDLARVLGVEPAAIGHGALRPTCASMGVPFVLVPLHDVQTLGRARVDTTAWREVLGDAWAQELFLFVPTGAPPDGGGERRSPAEIRARMFAPGLGIAEDPATGAACAALAGALGRHGAAAGEGHALFQWIVHQGVEMGRPSQIRIEAVVDAGGSVTAVRVEGSAVEVCRGTMQV